MGDSGSYFRKYPGLFQSLCGRRSLDRAEGPHFSKRIYGFWDGGKTFKVRFVTTTPGEWHWRSGSNQPEDRGLNSGQGKLKAIDWTNSEKSENANRHGFVRATTNGHALAYADGTPFFLVGDTWLAASTWRLPLKGIRAAPHYEPGPGISFEEAVSFRKSQGFNSISFIAAFPNWDDDHRGATYADAHGIWLRNAWEKFGHWAANGIISTADGATTTAKDMADEQGQRAFSIFPDREGLADFDHLNPVYFQSLDRRCAIWPTRVWYRFWKRSGATAARRGKLISISTAPTAVMFSI